MVERLFVYGTLRDPVVQQAVFGRIIQGTPDGLEGWRKTEMTFPDGTFPIIVADSSSRVDGLILEVTPDELARGDIYETDAYRRIRVRLASGAEAWVYCA